MARCLAEIPVGKLRISLPLFRGTTAAISRAAARRDLPGLDRLRALGIGSDATTLRLQEGQKLMVNSGTMYGPGGEGFIRLNIACPRTLLADGLERTARVLECC